MKSDLNQTRIWRRSRAYSLAPHTPPPPNPPASGPAQSFLSLPLPLPDARRGPRWPPWEAGRPEVVLYFVDYTLSGPGQPPEDSPAG